MTWRLIELPAKSFFPLSGRSRAYSPQGGLNRAFEYKLMPCNKNASFANIVRAAANEYMHGCERRQGKAPDGRRLMNAGYWSRSTKACPRNRRANTCISLLVKLRASSDDKPHEASMYSK